MRHGRGPPRRSGDARNGGRHPPGEGTRESIREGTAKASAKGADSSYPTVTGRSLPR